MAFRSHRIPKRINRDANGKLQRVKRDERKQRPEGKYESGEHHERKASPREGRPPTARQADREHDGERLDEFYKGSEEGGRHCRSDCCDTRHVFVPYSSLI